MRWRVWARQRRIAFPFYVCAPANDNWCRWEEYIP